MSGFGKIIVSPKQENKVIRVLDTVDITIRMSRQSTGGRFAVFEECVPPGYGVPTHIHKNEDEMFYIVEGTYHIWCEGRALVATPGDTVLLPRGIPHSFYNAGDTVSKTINTYLPGGFDEFVEVLSTMGNDIDLTNLGELGVKYGISYSSHCPWEDKAA
ncbi:cupin domain-containing protein [Burkholderia sp. JP2-270]|uniref:cupin domain-containing protein n=1 Tax=Burkholderia sp. JP2-270 TaxID=2217913 RepID=UPI000DA3B686|nr:cupin domain-containing protein [Burkholderia sp. JP2-270]AWV00665.1 cupin domain-containing protein [Burkholderia sp. JP2-270]